MEEPKDFPDLLRQEMFKRGLSQREFCVKFGVSDSQLSETLNRKRKMTIKFAKLLYTKLGVSAELLLTLKD